MQIRKASKKNIKARLGVFGPPGSGKTTLALATMKHLASKTLVIDSERGSSNRYADLFNFDVIDLEDFHPQSYMQAIKIAVESGYDGLIIDSFSHAWYAALNLVGQASNNMTGWREVRPLLRELNDQMLKAPCHVIATMRSKTPWEKTSTGKTAPRSQELAIVQAKDLEYEFDIFGEMRDRTLYISKSRCPGLQGKSFESPGENIAKIIKDWISGEPSPYQICKTWKSPDDAIAWAAKELPGSPALEKVQAMWTDLKPDGKGRKGKAWVDLVHGLKKSAIEEAIPY